MATDVVDAEVVEMPPERAVVVVRSLHRKLAQVMYEAERIPKNGTAPVAMGGYKFVQVGDAADFIRKALAEKLITMMPTSVRVVGQTDRPTKAGGTMTTVDLVTSWTLTDGESGESITIESFGAGSDGGDKYSGKASTSAMKYALLTGFLLSTGEDSELGDQPEGGTRRTSTATRRGAGREGAAASATPQEEGAQPVGMFTFTGALALKGTSDGHLRQTPTGHVLVFRFETGDGKPIAQVQAFDAMAVGIADSISDEPQRLVGLRATITGELFDAWFTAPADGDKPAHRVNFQRMRLTRIETPGWTLPAAEGASIARPATCGNVAADGLMAGAICREPDGHTGAHKSDTGSWPA